MAGVSVVRDRRAHWLRRVLWAFILTTALTAFSYEMVRGVRRLQKADITKSWSHTSPTALVFPAITVCTISGVKPSVVLNATRANITLADWQLRGVELLRWAELDLEQFLDAASYGYRELVSDCTLAGRPCSEAVRVSHPFSRMLGQCHTLTPRGAVPPTHLMSHLHLRLTESDPVADVPSGWLLALHPPELHWSDTAALLGLATVVLIPPRVSSQFDVKRTRTTSISTPRAPCDSRASMTDAVRCYDACPSSGDGGRPNTMCRLRWVADQPAGVPPCTSYSQFLDATGHRRLFLNMSSSESQQLQKLAACSNCSASCSAESYKIQGIDRIQLPVDPEAPDLVAAEINVRLVTELVDVAEKYDYDFSTLVSDIGGIAGLLLGASLLTLVELVDSLITARCR